MKFNLIGNDGAIATLDNTVVMTPRAQEKREFYSFVQKENINVGSLLISNQALPALFEY